MKGYWPNHDERKTIAPITMPPKAAGSGRISHCRHGGRRDALGAAGEMVYRPHPGTPCHVFLSNGAGRQPGAETQYFRAPANLERTRHALDSFRHLAGVLGGRGHQ